MSFHEEIIETYGGGEVFDEIFYGGSSNIEDTVESMENSILEPIIEPEVLLEDGGKESKVNKPEPESDEDNGEFIGIVDVKEVKNDDENKGIRDGEGVEDDEEQSSSESGSESSSSSSSSESSSDSDLGEWVQKAKKGGRKRKCKAKKGGRGRTRRVETEEDIELTTQILQEMINNLIKP